jgi:hypothetical protein
MTLPLTGVAVVVRRKWRNSEEWGDDHPHWPLQFFVVAANDRHSAVKRRRRKK